MTNKFKLSPTSSITPSRGEDLGTALARFAAAEEERFRSNPGASVTYWGETVADVMFVAADAFDAGASASIGHNRADRYQERAGELRRKAEALLVEAREQREAREGELNRAAFESGFNGGDASSYAFDRRAAFLVGAHFAREGRPLPTIVRVENGDAEASNYVEVDGTRFAVRYPGGKIVEATVEAVAA